MKSRICLALALLAAIPAIAGAQAFMIDFDTDPVGNPIPAGTILNTVYSSMGVTLGRVNAPSQSGWQVYANANRPPGFGTAPNVVSLFGPPYASDINENAWGLIQAMFDSPASSVCIAVWPVGPSHFAVIRAFDGSGALLAQQHSAPGVTGDLCISAFNIRKVEFSGAGSQWACFDNLQVALSGGPISGPFYLGATANQPGLNETRWMTDLEVLNRGTTTANYTVELLRWNQANATPASVSYSLEPGRSMRYANALSALFSHSGGATLRVAGFGGNIAVNARTYNNDPDGTFGQYIPALPTSQAVQPGMTRHLIHLSQSTSDLTGFRTNLGLISASPMEIVVRSRYFNAAGTLLGTRNHTLRPFESTQITKAFTAVTAGAVASGYIELSSTTPGAVFFGYASVVDNRSGDGIHVPAV